MLTGLGFVTAAGLGAALRLAATERWPGGHLGTMSVNVVGSFTLGLLAGADPTTFTIIGMGGLGTFTTFSTFAADAMALADHHRLKAAGHVATTLVLGLGAALLGLAVAS